MIVETIIISLAAIVLGGTWMGLRFAKEYDPTAGKIPDTSSESIKARNKAYQAVDESASYPSLSRGTVKTQVQLFPQAFSQEERKRLIAWANSS